MLQKFGNGHIYVKDVYWGIYNIKCGRGEIKCRIFVYG